MSICISYNRYQHNWYVGELHHAFANKMAELYSDVKIISLADMAQKYSEPLDQRPNSLASLFNIYNLIVYNTENNKGFLHSLADYALVLLEHETALNKLNIKAFAFCPHHTDTVVQQYSHLNIKLIPSFYILENWDDPSHIESARHNNKESKCYFNGLCYGHRELYVRHLKTNPFFVMRNKSDTADYRPKSLYYDEASRHKFGLSINGVAQICYRDVEYFGLGVLCIREPMSLITKDRLQSDVHYKTILDNFVTSNIFYPEKQNEVAQYIVDKIHSIPQDEIEYILHNARQWYENNAISEKQIEFLHSCLIENEII